MKLEDDIEEAEIKVGNLNSNRLRGIIQKDPELDKLEEQLRKLN